MGQEQTRVVVTGIGALTPIGHTKEAFWDALMKGTSGGAPITYFDATDFATTFACELKNFSVEDYIEKRTADRMDPYCQYAIVSSDQALKDSGLDLEAIDPLRIGVVHGSGIGGMTIYDQQFRQYLNRGPRRISPFFIPMLIPDIAAGQISMRHGLMGPNYATASACATSLHAIMDAFMLIRCGMADYMVCGGSEAPITPMSVGGFNSARALSTANENPAKASRPYDRDRDGFVMGEGAGSLILESLETAKARGAKIYGELVGVGATADAHHLTAPHPEGKGAMNAMKTALSIAGIKPEDIDYINTHGTATPLGDIAEITAIKNVFGDHAKKLSVSSTKSMTGHLLGAAGVVESIACLLAMQNQTVPPTINNDNIDPQIDLDITPNEPRKRKIEYALNNGFGFGGHNASLIFRNGSSL
ncbi:beta-ketoacyl-[acyl-carrier-protein] synthase II [Chlorobium phaeovibrioides]|uniref:3-oxoacyl-[acyl-carrier-protein] synthase 2 n=2 Tax=Chlorobium phaeovibrioides TaxID=1094 RepID=A0A432ASV5_CHLPH|nr:beta-ketoacyl-ACP synthase II [Chlorobium phaeovibrioides]HCD36520.1 beta-ketoacyl-[acyl-carrier-protein] synthase II [Chlorobium sp.]KAA6231852.1 beta-ketoacyl-ACP synthase II [Chlorobium phaeovibrioides]MWV53464.1 beta-ketoacyl-ACP synthase II [Chlorobium phaeovibrioides]QEQ57591.1 beta-ketoacyl-ACP synthase II [Chlorobium phaeovibrioides]RTY34466.1 beta-ketoacyl-[acyl-carrier-protein] synthase II [Chlorobium phaeovibrioides]